ncbi:hypothetical protein ES703_112436 [subsurface metagenome]
MAPKLHNKKPCIKTIDKLYFLFAPKVLNIPNSLILSSIEVFKIPLIRTPEMSIATIETKTKIITINTLKSSDHPKILNLGKSILYSFIPIAI